MGFYAFCSSWDSVTVGYDLGAEIVFKIYSASLGGGAKGFSTGPSLATFYELENYREGYSDETGFSVDGAGSDAAFDIE